MKLTYEGDISGTRASKYQDSLVQNMFNDETWKHIDVYHSLQEWNFHLNDLRADLEYNLDLDDQLHKELWAILIMQGTPNQIQVATLIYKGFTQMEIAKEMGIGQPDVAKTLKGNWDYSFDPPRINGGIAKKLEKEIKKSNSIRKIMLEMWKTDNNCYTAHYTAFKSIFKNYQEYTKWLQGEMQPLKGEI